MIVIANVNLIKDIIVIASVSAPVMRPLPLALGEDKIGGTLCNKQCNNKKYKFLHDFCVCKG